MPTSGTVELASPFATGERRLALHAGGVTVPTFLSMPEAPKALVLAMAGDLTLALSLAAAGFATVVVDLRADGVGMLALLDALAAEPATAGLAIAIVAEAESVTAALNASAARPRLVFAVVCSGGRPQAAPGAAPLLASAGPAVIGAFLDLHLAGAE